MFEGSLMIKLNLLGIPRQTMRNGRLLRLLLAASPAQAGIVFCADVAARLSSLFRPRSYRPLVFIFLFVSASILVLSAGQTLAGITITDSTNITLAFSQTESGGDTSENPDATGGAGGPPLFYTESGSFTCCGASFLGGNLDDGDVGVGNASDGTYALPDSGTLTLNFGSTKTVTSIIIYNGYTNRDDGTYTLRDDASNVLGAWTISTGSGTSNDGADSFWLTFDTPVTTSSLSIEATVADCCNTASYREIAVRGLGAGGSATVHPLTGNARFDIGGFNLPIPIGFTAPPTGKILAVPGALVTQPLGADPRAIVFGGRELKRSPAQFVLPVFAVNPAVFQVMTSIGVTYPLGVNSLSAGGRTGAATVHYCAGQVVTPSGDPGCASPGAGTGINGLLIYTATGAQFGGAMSGRIFGNADVALFGGGSFPPCSGTMCIIGMALSDPNSTGTGGVGSAFGGSGMSAHPGPPSGILSGMVSAAGKVSTANPILALPGFQNPTTRVGGPWTTGKVTVSVTAALAGAEIFFLSGDDSRVSGVGAISLVAGGMSNRGIAGPKSHRGWLNLVIGNPIDPPPDVVPPPGAVPMMSGPAIAVLVGLMSVVGGYAMRRRMRN